MVFPIVGGTQSTGYEISNSLRFNNNDTAYLNISRSSQSNTTGTFSVWTKMGVPSDDNVLFGGHTDVNNRGYIYFSDPDGYVGIFSRTSGSADIAYNSNGRFRDPSAWYHVVVAIDTTQGTAGNRFKMYINGTQYTDWGTATAPSQNASLPILNKAAQTVGGGYGSSSVSSMADSYLADFYYIDGQQLDASNFGETNDNGVWIPKKYLGTYGTNGFKLEFQQTGTGTASASTIGADTSGNDNHLTSNNLAATDVTVDTPTNNFATMNPIHKSVHGSAALPTFAEGNLSLTFGADSSTSSTIAPSKGKWYVEYKQGENTADNQGYPIVGISTTLGGTAGDVIGFRTPDSSNYRGQLGTTSVNNAFGSARSAGDIFGFYINLDDDILIVHKNGSDYMGSGASSGLDWSGGLTTTNQQTGFYHFYGQSNTNNAFTDLVNFGNPPFSISSSNADANGYGSFEYSPTLSGTAFYAMCTKNLAEFG